MSIGQVERATQNRIVSLFQSELGYTYLGNWEDRSDNSNIEVSHLRAYLTRAGYSEGIIDKALYEFTKVAGDQSKGLYDLNKEVYSMLRYGVKVRTDISENHQTVTLIDWKYPENNNFAIAEEVTIQGENKKRPDIVIYINGIALGVIELKRSTVSVSEGIRQNLDNQKEIFIKRFFSTIQLIMAGNDTEGVRYGTIETPEKYYLAWKELSDTENLLDRHIMQLCDKTRFLELMHDFIVFDAGTKKLCRTHQYFGVKKTQERIRKREGGIIWHSQGSGKSLTMVWLAKWIRENVTASRVLIITDRTELDEQIEKVFKGVNEDIYRITKKNAGTDSGGKHLIDKLNESSPWLLCSLIHKFGNKSETDDVDYDTFIDDIKKSLPKDFKAKGDIYVLVDECHRSQAGKLHDAMKLILPNAIFLGFTGTPLLKTDRLTTNSIGVFGSYIHTYKFDEAVKDGVVLDLRYEARNIDQAITSPDKIDLWFDVKTNGLNDFAKATLKKKWGTMQRVLSCKSRLEKIVSDIMLDMETKPGLADGHGNAMLVAGSIYEACKYYELFQSAGLKKCAIVTSYSPQVQDLKGQTSNPDEENDQLKKYDIYNKMLGGKSAEDFEKEAKQKFIDEPGQMKLLIVVDKLLTGFDAPSATYLYIDKHMQDHGLFQAICRVNRLDGEGKEYGYIIDYKDLFKSLESAITDYTSEAFVGYEKADVQGLLSARLLKGKEDLDTALETVKALCEPVPHPQGQTEYGRYFCGESQYPESAKETEPNRVALYKHVSHLIRAYVSIANELDAAGYTPSEIEKIRKDVQFYENLKQEIMLTSGDHIDIKAYEPAMRYLIDQYIRAEDSKKISNFDDMSLVELLVNKGVDALNDLPKSLTQNEETLPPEGIENNLRKVIIEEKPTNPKYFEEMSVLLDELIKERNKNAMSYKEYLDKIIELSRKVANGSGPMPDGINTKAKKAIYDNLGNNRELTLAIDAAFWASKQDGWTGNFMKEKAIKNSLRPLLSHLSDSEFDTFFGIIKSQNEYR